MHDHTGRTAHQNQGAFYRVKGNGDWLINQLTDCLTGSDQIQKKGRHTMLTALTDMGWPASQQAWAHTSTPQTFSSVPSSPRGYG